MPGPAILAATAALRAGAGKLQIGTCASIAVHVGAAVPEALVRGFEETPSGAIAAKCGRGIREQADAADALVFGPGLAQDTECGQVLASLLPGLKTPVVLDAAALQCLGDRPELLRDQGVTAVLTPHPGELAALLGCHRDRIDADPVACVRQAVRQFQAVVALKGAQTYILSPGGTLYCNAKGHVGLATSGSGDTLAGIIGGILARGATPEQAAVWGVFAHAQAGLALARKFGLGFLARELPAEIPPVMRRIQSASG